MLRAIVNLVFILVFFVKFGGLKVGFSKLSVPMDMQASCLVVIWDFGLIPDCLNPTVVLKSWEDVLRHSFAEGSEVVVKDRLHWGGLNSRIVPSSDMLLFLRLVKKVEGPIRISLTKGMTYGQWAAKGKVANIVAKLRADVVDWTQLEVALSSGQQHAYQSDTIEMLEIALLVRTMDICLSLYELTGRPVIDWLSDLNGQLLLFSPPAIHMAITDFVEDAKHSFVNIEWNTNECCFTSTILPKLREQLHEAYLS